MAIYQIRSNQTKPSQVVYYILLGIIWETTTKNFRSLGPMGAEIMGPEAGTDFFTKLSVAPKRSSSPAKPFNHLWDGLGQYFLAKKIKNLGIAFFRTAVFRNHGHITDQTKPNQTSQSGILHFARHRLRAYHKKFQVSRSNGSRDNGSGKFKIWKLSILGFFEKGPPGPPKKVKKWFQWYFWLLGTHMGSQKFVCRFSGRGVKKCVQADWTAPDV